MAKKLALDPWNYVDKKFGKQEKDEKKKEVKTSVRLKIEKGNDWNAPKSWQEV